jgi:hypothetical protein
MKRNGFSVLLDFKIRSTIWNDLSVTETFPCKRISVTKICLTLKLQKKEALPIHYKTVLQEKCSILQTLQIRFRSATDEYASWEI